MEDRNATRCFTRTHTCGDPCAHTVVFLSSAPQCKAAGRWKAEFETVEEEGAGGSEDSGSSLRGVTEEAAVTVAEASAEDELDQGEAVVQEALV